MRKMSFSEMFAILKQKEKRKILFVQCGHFYIAIGEDAVFLHQKLDLKCTCFKNHICKVGVPTDALEKYLRKLEQLKYAYIVYDYEKTKKELIKKCVAIGKYHTIQEKTINCLQCKGISKYKEEEYIMAVAKLLKKEEENKNFNIEEVKNGK